MVSLPRALYGTQADVERSIVRVAREWADDVRTERTLRQLDTIEVGPGTIVYCDEASDFAPMQAGWRIFGLRGLRVEVGEALDWNDRAQIAGLVEQALLGTPAGVLWLNVGRPEPNTPAVVRARLEALLVQWDGLRALALMDGELQPQSLEEVIEAHYGHLLMLWAQGAQASLRDRLRSAIETCVAAPPDETRQRIATALGQLARSDSRLRRPERFADLSWVESQLATAPLKEYESARTGATLKRLLYSLDRR